jgi:hypothetical protein
MERILLNPTRCATVVSLLVGGLALMVAVPTSTAKDLTLAWNSSTSTNVIGYRLYYGTASRKYDHTVDVRGALQTTVPGFAQGLKYYFAATAYDSFGLESDPSDEISYSVPRPPAGIYSGLFHEDDEIDPNTAGWLTVSVTAHGSYTGQLLLGSGRYSFSGRLGPDGDATNIVRRSGAGALTVQLHVGTDAQVDEISGRVTDGTWVALLAGDRAVFRARDRRAPYAGRYTLIVPGQEDAPTVPAGIGYGTVRVSVNGRASFAGSLADGTKVTQRVPLSKHGLWPFSVSLYSGRGLVMSWMAFTNEVDSDFHGALSWIKPADPRAQYYPGGFTNECRAIGSAYAAPAGAVNSVLNLTTATVVISGGNLSSELIYPVALGPGGQAGSLSGNELTLRFSLATGTFKGKAVDPNSGQSLSFNGVVMPKLNAGYGFLLGTSQSSRVVIAE